jgi:hypothetical protein
VWVNKWWLGRDEAAGKNGSTRAPGIEPGSRHAITESALCLPLHHARSQSIYGSEGVDPGQVGSVVRLHSQLASGC